MVVAARCQHDQAHPLRSEQTGSINRVTQFAGHPARKQIQHTVAKRLDCGKESMAAARVHFQLDEVETARGSTVDEIDTRLFVSLVIEQTGGNRDLIGPFAQTEPSS